MLNKKEAKKREKFYNNEFEMPPECDLLCRFRRCYQKSENKGSFSVGRGYTNYHKTFYPACAVRLNNGCPNREATAEIEIKALKYIKLKLLGNAKEKRYAMKVLDALINQIS